MGRLTVWPDQAIGAAVWLLPAQAPIRDAEARAKDEFLAESLGVPGRDAYRGIVDFMKRRASAIVESAWYLSIVGVAPAAQGRGVGARLIEPTLVEADDVGVDCYLETFDRRNQRFYQRLGFSAVSSHSEPITGATYAIMLRRPWTRSTSL